ncbi:MAG: DinB family protein [Gemmatimonadaceae bacterium]|jgi:hypothetical protein|nr:DinB family protein [Gemmatimonadaceae bacterium]
MSHPSVPALHPRIALILAELDAARAELLVLVEPLDDARVTAAPPEGGWSPLEILGHLGKVEDGISRMVRKLVREAQAAGLPVETDMDVERLVASIAAYDIVAAERRMIAPPPLLPTPDRSRAEVMQLLADARARLVEWLTIGSGHALGTLRWPHPFFGALDVYQWGLFTAHHERRHARQIARALAMA